MKNKFLFSVFVYFIILVLISLGSWQLYRLSWKLDLIKQIENSLKNKPVELSDVEEKNFLRIKTSGKIIFQKQIRLEPDETPLSLSKKILKEEHTNYPVEIEKLLTNDQ